ncbi:MAG: PAS domain-containing sensor histidine kinase [Thiovulaceae bacterium]|nr:PAS domain-containing sensor histidine kinase [Sulfurimonadaceae bacterium]
MGSAYSHLSIESSDKTLNSILDVISEGTWDWNVLTGHVHRSAGWYHMLEYDVDCFDANVVTWKNVIHHEDYDRVMSHFEDYISGKSDFYKIQYRCKKGDGTYLWIEDSGKIIERDENGALTRMIGAHTNINEIKLAQENLLEKNALLLDMNATLEARIEKAVEEIHQKEVQLLQQSRLAQMGEMISMIAHQWRQPLTAISAISIDLQMKLILDDYKSKDKKPLEKFFSHTEASLKKIDSYILNLTTTIDDFRNFYKPNKKSVKIKLEDVIEKSLNIIKPSLGSYNITIIEQYNSKEKIELYENEMMQVILNILKNAQDHLNEKNIKDPYIKIITEDNTIFICDNGGGIPENIIEKIFDPYFSTKYEKNGTGLGLYMSKTIVEEHHHGRLIAENKDDGACFVIALGALPKIKNL